MYQERRTYFSIKKKTNFYIQSSHCQPCDSQHLLLPLITKFMDVQNMDSYSLDRFIDWVVLG